MEAPQSIRIIQSLQMIRIMLLLAPKYMLIIKLLKKLNRGIFRFIYYVPYSELLHLPPLRFRCVGGCLDQTQDFCDFCIGSQTL
jgi:hypothetical protein